MKRILLVILVGLFTSSPALAQVTSKEVIACIRANMPAKLRAQTFELESTGRSGSSRKLQGKLYAMDEKGLLRIMLRVQDPPDVAGSAYLLREAKDEQQDHIYLFLPALNRVRRLSGGEAGQSLFGTDFSYSDFKQMQVGYADGDSVLEAPAEVEKRPAHVLVQKPKDAKESPYSLTRSWVDQKTCVILKTDFYVGEQLRKQLTSSIDALRQMGTHWYLSRMLMTDLKEGTHSTLAVELAVGEKDLSQFYFNPSTFSVISK
jgi:outer membrane lipoprotein-sorting protein